MIMLEVDDLENRKFDANVQPMRPTYARKSKLHDLIVVSGIGEVIEEKPSKKAVKDSEIKNDLYTIINSDSKKRRKTSIRVHLSTAPEAECSVVKTSKSRLLKGT